MRTGKPFSMPPVRVISPTFESQVESSKSLKEWLRTEETVRGICFSKQMEESMDCSYKSITNCTFSHVQFNNCKLKATHFTDVRFEHCDLSNISFAESSLFRVEFISCKLFAYRGYSRQSAGYTGSYRQYPPSHGPDKPAGTRNKRLNNFPFSLVIPMEFTFKIK